MPNLIICLSADLVFSMLRSRTHQPCSAIKSAARSAIGSGGSVDEEVLDQFARTAESLRATSEERSAVYVGHAHQPLPAGHAPCRRDPTCRSLAAIRSFGQHRPSQRLGRHAAYGPSWVYVIARDAASKVATPPHLHLRSLTNPVIECLR